MAVVATTRSTTWSMQGRVTATRITTWKVLGTYTLSFSDGHHAVTSSEPTLGLPLTLQVDDAVHEHYVETVTIGLPTSLVVNSATHVHTASTPTPSGVVTTLVPANAKHVHVADTVPVIKHARVHGIICSYLGDGEYDIGKTGAWLNSHVNTLFFYDMSYGQAARRYAVDYAKTFPDAQFAYHPATVKGFYEDAALFRQMAFQAALDAWRYADGDWVVFIDASESLSTNTPLDLLQPDAEWPELLDVLLNEARAGTNAIKLPFYVFLQQGVVTENIMSADTVLGNQLRTTIPALQASIAAETDPAKKAQMQADLANAQALQEANDSVVYWSNDPHYLSGANALDRMFKVGYAKTLTTTAAWRRVDTFAQASGSAAQRATIISYGYARFGEGPPPWTEADDGGFANRKLVQQVRTVSLPEVYATADPAGVAHPAGTQSGSYCYLYQNYDTGDGNPNFNQYVALWRQNPRDGVWYINYTLGPVPTDPLTGDPSVDPDDWERQQTSTTGPVGTGRP